MHCGINTRLSPHFFLLPNTSSTFEEAIIISENLISMSWDVEANSEQYTHHTGKTEHPGAAGFSHTDTRQQLRQSVSVTPKRSSYQ